jgi:hypothetical protein
MVKHKENRSTTPGHPITDYSINAKGRDVILGFQSNGIMHEFAISHAEACRFAGRLLNQADYWACSHASARYSGHGGNFLMGGLSEAVAGGDLTEGQADKIRNRVERQTGVL